MQPDPAFLSSVVNLAPDPLTAAHVVLSAARSGGVMRISTWLPRFASPRTAALATPQTGTIRAGSSATVSGRTLSVPARLDIRTLDATSASPKTALPRFQGSTSFRKRLALRVRRGKKREKSKHSPQRTLLQIYCACVIIRRSLMSIPNHRLAR